MPLLTRTVGSRQRPLVHPHDPHGVALVDKPAGMSSFSVVSRLRRVMRRSASMVRHTGTLDPSGHRAATDLHRRSHQFAQRCSIPIKGIPGDGAVRRATTTGDVEGEVTRRSDRAHRRAGDCRFAALHRANSANAACVLGAQIAGKPTSTPGPGRPSRSLPARSPFTVSRWPSTRPGSQRLTSRCSAAGHLHSVAGCQIWPSRSVSGHLAGLRRTRRGIQSVPMHGRWMTGWRRRR